MKITKLFFFTVCAATAILMTSACGLFEDPALQNTAGFYRADFDRNGKTDPINENEKINGGNGPLDLIPNDPRKLSPNSDWDSNPAALGEDYAGFGKRINGVTFEPVYFFFDQDNVPMNERAKIRAVAQFLQQRPDAAIVVEGNCDNRGTEEYNRALGEKRAISVKIVLTEEGISENRIHVLSYGEERPAASGDNENSWSLNRRAEFVPVQFNAR